MGSVKTKRKLLDYLESNSKDNIFTISTKKKIAESVGVSVSTINNNLKKLEEENKIAVATKKGHNGGIVITLIKERFNTEDLVEFNKSNDNIIQSAQKYAEDLRDKHFPTYTYQRKENRRRTKQEMAKYKAIKDKNRRIILDMNLELSNMNYPSKEVFNMSYDPEGFYKAYILCKLYDTYCIAHMNARRDFHERRIEKNDLEPYQVKHHKKYIEFYKNQLVVFLSKNSVSDNFFGSKTFNTFYNFYNKIKDLNNFNVFLYMQNVFNNVSYVYENTNSSINIPMPNYFNSDKYFEQYYKYIDTIKKNVNNTQRHLGDTELLVDSTIYKNNPALNQLQQMYMSKLNDEIHDIDTMFEKALDLEDLEFGFVRDNKHLTLLNFSDKVDKAIKDMEKEEAKVINKFVKQLIINEYAPTSFSSNVRTSLFPMQRHHIISELELNNIPLKDNLINIGLVSDNADLRNLTKQDISNLTSVAYDYLVLSKNSSTYYVLRMFADFMGYEVNIRDVKHILTKYNLEDLIPLTSYGMLDYNRLKRESEKI
ncbi:hypothetical protein BESEP7_00110 [Staphylococcus phage vB_SepM_BE07]|nr:hypothetical protein BESEP6_00091 [Staphylococcus phage vB_SepM_BE06]QLF87458.1 hypothetical protein BESEP7_00110 [Staphylococcus phage vB_SepM_BE07]QLF87742.1 hypothetical protein BESEP8_00194 [Staphylococcus phage vB_SepM_BE08]WEU70356.1 HTH DNA binding protein [Staphylococcus phage vB_SepM_BE24]